MDREGEERWLSLGPDKSVRLLVVCHTHRDVTGWSDHLSPQGQSA